MKYEELSIFLTNIILKKNIVMDDIAKLSEISPAFLSDLKKGKKSCKKETWEIILKYLRLTKEEETEGWLAWSYSKIDKNTKDFIKHLQEENSRLKKVLEYVEFKNKQ
ncbi:hypothetical protein SAMN02745174_02617 [Cetobacterium ceti]|uniref:HTH cro/C1-type domain-containing protein n=1 Tax=Cetobacterium ceti TaxID=180163 RepID=A0A1T4R9T0_9FUSO|nr:hypothetical protein [Cetobacterium ceti]SKA12381.1 hypothetical protein SAMN02745174_02617 [Cetobacterium ceti]